MPNRLSEKTLLVGSLAARPQGVSCREFRAASGLEWNAAGNRLDCAQKALGLFKVKPEGHHTRWFISEAQFNEWWATDPAPPPPALVVRKSRRAAAAPTVSFPRPPAPRVEPIAAAAPAPAVVWRARTEPGPAAFPAQATAVGQPTGVPGWGGPHIRAGAFDFRRHQHKGGY